MRGVVVALAMVASMLGCGGDATPASEGTADAADVRGDTAACGEGFVCCCSGDSPGRATCDADGGITCSVGYSPIRTK